MIMLTLLACIAITISSMADDTEIYGSNTVAVRPNVLIIFDTSSSMEQDYIKTAYDSSTTYANDVIAPNPVYTPKDDIYYRKNSNSAWQKYPYTISQAGSCLNNLITNGTLDIKLNSDKKCPNPNDKNLTSYQLRTANFMNYVNSNSAISKQKYVVAKEVISKLVKDNPDKNYGLMIFRDELKTASYWWGGAYTYYSPEGGTLVYPCKDTGLLYNSDIYNYINAMNNQSFYNPYGDGRSTPLAETLAEAGHYFAGMVGWFSGTDYTSPITQSCQANYIILVTDGMATSDNNPKLYNGTVYMGGDPIGNADHDTNNEDYPDSNHYLDDVAYFLNHRDIYTDGPKSEGTQTLRIFTIGFGVTKGGDAEKLLYNTANDGDGDYFPATNGPELASALNAINEQINQTTSVFLAPSIPVNRTSKTDQSDWIYLAFFKPQKPGEWLGNIKKFALGKNGEIYGRNPAVSDPNAPNYIDKSKEVVDELGQVKNNACSFWSVSCPDGNEVAAGGVGELLQSKNETTNPRTLYYYTGTKPALTDTTNVFKDTNATLLAQILSANPDLTITPATVVNDVRKFLDDWKLGAIIHSEPAVVHYSNTQSLIFVGANDGMLHCFDDNTGNELWGFIPPGQISNIDKISDGLHDYYVDGSPVVTYGDLISGTQLFQPKFMIFGERRGGDKYYVLDITDPNAPQWKYQIDPTILGASEKLGQSWSKPVVCTLATKTDTLANSVKVPGGLTEVFLIGGGYDYNQDNDPPTSTIDTDGKAIFAVNTSTGTLTSSSSDGSLPLFKVTDLTSITGITASNGSFIKNCIVDVRASSTVATSGGKDITTRIYAGDLGGKVYAFSDDMTIDTVEGVKTLLTRVPDGGFPIKLCLFSAPGKKIFYAPGVSRMSNTFSEYVVFGTGDREKPKKIKNIDGSKTQDGIYVVKNTWLNVTPYIESDLTNLTENVLSEGSSDAKKEVANALSKSHGWYVNFYDEGEKLISKPIVTHGYIYFTTYVPPGTISASTDPCSVGDAGYTYLWSIELETGIPVHDTNNDGKKEKKERRQRVAVMAQPTLTGDLISTPASEQIPGKINSNYFFWRQR